MFSRLLDGRWVCVESPHDGLFAGGPLVEVVGAVVGDAVVLVVGAGPPEDAGCWLFELPAAAGFGAVQGSGEGAEVVGPGLVVDAVGVGDGVVEVESAG